MEAKEMQELRARFRGELITPSDAAYEAARKVYNGMIDRRPALIARCADVADVMAGVVFAREKGLLLAVRGGGHNGPGLGSVNDGLKVTHHGFQRDIRYVAIRQRATTRVIPVVGVSAAHCFEQWPAHRALPILFKMPHPKPRANQDWPCAIAGIRDACAVGAGGKADLWSVLGGHDFASGRRNRGVGPL